MINSHHRVNENRVSRNNFAIVKTIPIIHPSNPATVILISTIVREKKKDNKDNSPGNVLKCSTDNLHRFTHRVIIRVAGN